MTGRTYLSVATLLSAACRFGGPEGSATELIEVDAGRALEAPEPDLDEDNTVVDDPTIPDARQAAPDAITSDAATAQASDSSVAACWASAGLACDPVGGLGCLPLMQCVIDPSSSTPAAHCVFSGIMLDATCTEDALSTNCPLQHTCMMGECRKYCCRDSDCEGGASCVDSSGANASAFKLCQPPTP
jgi:hypothetical protein